MLLAGESALKSSRSWETVASTLHLFDWRSLMIVASGTKFGRELVTELIIHFSILRSREVLVAWLAVSASRSEGLT